MPTQRGRAHPPPPAPPAPAPPARPATRAWARLVAEARDDEERAAALRAEADRHLAAAEAAAARRAARRTAKDPQQQQRPPTEALAHRELAPTAGGTRARVSAAESEIADAAAAAERPAVKKPVAASRAAAAGGAVAPATETATAGRCAGFVESGETPGASETRPAAASSGAADAEADEQGAAAAPTPEELAPARPWASRVAAIKRFSEAMAAAAPPAPGGGETLDPRRALLAGLAPALAAQLRDLRSMVVVAAADALVPAAPACGPPEARILLDAALAVVVKTKAVMAEAGLRVAKAIVKYQPSDGEIWDHVVSALSNASHAKARLCAAECVCVLAEMTADPAPKALGPAIQISVLDKSEDVRAAGRAALAMYTRLRGESAAAALVAEMSEPAQARVTVANGAASSAQPADDAPKSGSTASISANAKPRNVPSASASNGVAAVVPDSEATTAAKPLAPKPSSLRDVIRNKRLAMKQSQSDRGAEEGEVATLPKRSVDEDETIEDSLDARKKRDDAHLSPQKGIPKRRVLDASGNPMGE